MAVCDRNALLADGKCFVPLPEQVQNALVLQLWCTISGGSPPPPSGGGNLFNPDANAGIGSTDAGAPLNNPDA